VLRSIDRVTAEDVQALAVEIFDPSAVGLAAIGPVSEKDLTLGILKCE
jgi:predicted Zn-dependent peptidase